MKKYSKIGLFKSKGRIFKESSSKYRTPFQRDRDRIVHSASFRRLKHKTQVFVNTEGDHYRTRITHSIEVAQIARSIARYLHLNEDLAETLSLAHDLGHTPFGHAGEDALNECMEDYGGFDHNLQTLRIVMFLENKYLKFSGLNSRGIVASFMVASAVLSMWVMNTSTAIMLLPVGISVIKVISDTVNNVTENQKFNFQLCLLLGIAYAASVGGIATPIGTSPNGVLIQFASNNYDYDIGFTNSNNSSFMRAKYCFCSISIG